MIALARMAKSSNRPLSDWFGIDDPDIAFAFDLECSEILAESEREREKQMFEAMGIGQVTNALGGAQEGGSVERW